MTAVVIAIAFSIFMLDMFIQHVSSSSCTFLLLPQLHEQQLATSQVRDTAFANMSTEAVMEFVVAFAVSISKKKKNMEIAIAKFASANMATAFVIGTEF